MVQREAHAKFFSLMSKEIGEPVVKILELMESFPERFDVANKYDIRSVLTIYTVKDKENGFEFSVSSCAQEVMCSDGFKKNYDLPIRCSDSIIWATNTELLNLLYGAKKLQRWIDNKKKEEADTKLEEQKSKGRAQTMELYNLVK